jgi:trehalose 6-phosphate synthase
MLWFLQHYLWELAYTPSVDVAFQHAWDEGYARVNEGFAEAVLEELELEPGAAVFFHDYHLYLAPRLVRERAPDALLAHFVHIPWPQADYWHVLPEPIRGAVHDGLLANDVVGFHTQRWRLNFLRTASDLGGASCDFGDKTAAYRGRRSLVTVHPISVEPAEFDELARSEEVLAAERHLVARRPEKLVLRVDRTDPSKNIVRGFRAFELYLDAHPEMHREVGMLALLDPSRQEIPEYAEYLGAVQREARRVNDRFQQAGWLPIELVIEDDFAASVAAYKQFDVLFVNAIFDGMNLIAKEAPLVNERDGVLILSENAGSHDELGDWALSVSPFDVAGQAEAIDRALTMPAGERRERLQAICEQVREHDVTAWIEAQLADLDRRSASVT